MKIRTKTSILLTVSIALLTAAFLYLSAEHGIANYPSRGTDIIAFGDSLVQGVGSSEGGGFIKMMSEDLDIPIINLGVSGNTTEDALDRIKVLDNYDPALVILLVGGNDYLAGTSEEKIKENLSKIIDEIHSRGAAVLLLGLQTSVLDEKHAELFKSLAQEKKTAYVPDIMRGVFGVRGRMSDSLHPNDTGYRIIADRIEPILENLMN